jgi:hypothetical protein
MGSEQGDETLPNHSRCPQYANPTLTSLGFLHADLSGNRTPSDTRQKEKEKKYGGCFENLSASVFF